MHKMKKSELLQELDLMPRLIRDKLSSLGQLLSSKCSTSDVEDCIRDRNSKEGTQLDQKIK